MSPQSRHTPRGRSTYPLASVRCVGGCDEGHDPRGGRVRPSMRHEVSIEVRAGPVISGYIASEPTNSAVDATSRDPKRTASTAPSRASVSLLDAAPSSRVRWLVREYPPGVELAEQRGDVQVRAYPRRVPHLQVEPTTVEGSGEVEFPVEEALLLSDLVAQRLSQGVRIPTRLLDVRRRRPRRTSSR